MLTLHMIAAPLKTYLLWAPFCIASWAGKAGPTSPAENSNKKGALCGRLFNASEDLSTPTHL